MESPLPPSFFDLQFKDSIATVEFDNYYTMTVLKEGEDSFTVQLLNRISNSTEALVEDASFIEVDAMMEFVFELKEPIKVLH